MPDQSKKPIAPKEAFIQSPPNSTASLEYLITQQLDQSPAGLPIDKRGPDILSSDSTVILQILPSGTCLTLDLVEPVVLGRQVQPPADNLIDLSQYRAYGHGISRRHCLLKRRGTELMLMDLGSANGTYINHIQLPPFVDHSVAHGDRLILGDLIINVFFSAIGEPQDVDE